MVQRHDISWIKAYAIAIASLLSGAAVVHNIFKPDLVGFCSWPEHDTKASSIRAEGIFPATPNPCVVLPVLFGPCRPCQYQKNTMTPRLSVETHPQRHERSCNACITVLDSP